MEELEKEKQHIEERIAHYEKQHKSAVEMANYFKKQLKTVDRAMAAFKEVKDGKAEELDIETDKT